MNHRRNFLCTLASLFFLALPPAAHGAGDPARGNMLYQGFYACSSCHTASPPTNVAFGGATVAGLLAAINNVPVMNGYAASLAQNPTDLADISAYLASLTGPPPTTPDLNQHGLTGIWYEPATSGQGIEVEVFPNLLSPGSGFAQLSFYTYDTAADGAAAGGADSQRWYTIGGAVTSGQPSAALTIYQNTGGNFNALPITMAQAVGTATLSFATCSSGQLAYTFTDGRMGNIPLTRLMQNVTCSTTTPFPTNADFAFSGTWFNPPTSGQGLTVEVNPIAGQLFAAWFTYAPSGAAAGAAGQRWFTAQGTFTTGLRSIPVTIYQITDGIFDTPTPPGQKTEAVGTGTLAFQSCTAATFSYNFTAGSSSGLSGIIPLSRVSAVPPGCTS